MNNQFKNVMTVGVFAFLPVLILIACQTTPATTMNTQTLAQKQLISIKKDVRVMLSRTSHLDQYKMKAVDAGL